MIAGSAIAEPSRSLLPVAAKRLLILAIRAALHAQTGTREQSFRLVVLLALIASFGAGAGGWSEAQPRRPTRAERLRG